MIVISGGGTGGHLAIAKSLCEELNRRGIKPLFIGSTQGQDRTWFENDENFSDKIFLQSSGVVNKRGLAKLGSLLNILKLALKCRKIFKARGVRAVVSVGGYSAAPAALGALLCGVKLFIHEQNAVTGKLNQILKLFAAGFFSSYDKISPYAYPVAERFFTNARSRRELKTILFLGGSQGAKAINELALKIAPALKSRGIKIIHQCGKNALNDLKEKYTQAGLKICENFSERNFTEGASDDYYDGIHHCANANTNADVELFDFYPHIEQKMACADLAISRAGAGSLWELCANRLPAIFVPFPYAAGNHQYFNAKFLEDEGLAKICPQDGEEINCDKILAFLENYDLEHASDGLKAVLSQNGAKDIIDKILAKI